MLRKVISAIYAGSLRPPFEPVSSASFDWSRKQVCLVRRLCQPLEASLALLTYRDLALVYGFVDNLH